MNRKIQLFIILLTAGMDIFHLGIVYPIFVNLTAHSGVLYALLIGAFPFAQCIGAPLLGRWSDQYGRGRLLKLTVAGSACGMAITAFGIILSQMWLIIAGRLIGGIMGGNMSIAYAAITDISTQENKVRNLALIPLTLSLGFVLGPLLVGLLSTSALWVAVLLSICNWGLLWLFKDTARQVTPKKMGFLLLRKPQLWPPVIVLFAMISANLLLVQYVGPYGVNRLHLNLQNVSWLYVNLSVAVAIGHLLLTRNISFPPHKTLPWSLFALALSLFAVSQATTLVALHITLAIAMFCCAIAYTNAFAYLSNHGSADEQGEIMGVGVSMQCLAEWTPALAVSAITIRYPSAPMIVGAIACIVGNIILWRRNEIRV